MPPRYYRHLRDAPEFVRAVQEHRAKGRTRPVTARLEDFADDPFLLYACVWYAWTCGVAVCFRPSRSAAGSPQQPLG